MSEVLNRITEYLTLGGLFNPELMEHEKVRDLILSCRKEIESLKAELKAERACTDFYAEEETYMRSPFSDVARELIAEDCDNVEGYAKYCGGKFARETQKKRKVEL